MLQVLPQALLRARREGREDFVALERVQLLFRRERSHAEEDSLPRLPGTAPASLFEQLSAALRGLGVEFGQPLPELLLCGEREAPKERILLEDSRLLFGRKSGNAQEEIAQRSLAHRAAAVPHLGSLTLRARRRLAGRRLLGA